MFQSKNPYFNQVKDFHARMDGHTQESPRAYEMEEALHRADFKLEEIVEFLQATVTRESDWDRIVDKLHLDLDKAAEKVKEVASYVTASNNEDVLYQAALHFGLLEEPSYLSE